MIQSSVLQNRYRILRQLGGGGMGAVYLAEDMRLAGFRCAIKEFSPANLPPSERGWAITAFQREAKMLANLRHPGLTAVTDFFAEGSNSYLVMDFVDGETLGAWLARSPGGRLPLNEVLEIARQICDVLEYLHRQAPPIIFRDLKPANVMVTPLGQVKLIDFGIVRFFKPGKTHDTVMLGTPGYAAPEQYGGLGQSDPRTDIYSLGVLLHQLLTGYDPTSTFPGAVLPPLGAMFPAHIQWVIHQATQIDPIARFDSVTALRQALFPVDVRHTTGLPGLDSRPVSSANSGRARMPAYLAGLLVFCALLVVGGIWGVRTFLSKGTAIAPPTTTVAPPLSIEAEPTVVTLRSGIAPPTAETETPEALSTLALTPLPVSQILIPATTFQAGASEADLEFAAQLCAEYNLRDCRTPFEDELPRGLVDTPEADVYYLENREMTLSAFYIDLHEVTFAHYRACVEAGVCSRPVATGVNPRRLYYDNSAYADYPVIYITWQDADTFCRWRGARLPTAWEWELAARGTDDRRFPWGNSRPARQSNYRTPEGTPATEEDTTLQGGNIKPVGTYADDRSPYGVMDMGGNVMEWVAGWYGTNMREIRGGSWNTAASTTRTTSRVHTDPRQPNQAYFDVGFRCVQDSKP